MPPVFGPCVVVEDRACDPAPCRAATARRPSQSAKNDTSGPLRHSSSTTRAPAAPNWRSSIAARIAASAVFAIGRDDNALAGREAVGLDDDRQAELAARDTACAVGRVVADPIARRRNAVARHELLRERPCCTRAARRRARDRRSAAPRPGTDRRCRVERQLGPDDGEIDPLALGERQEAVDVARRSIGTRRGDVGRCRRCRARTTTSTTPAFAGELPRERMLTAAAADDEQLHRADKSVAEIEGLAEEGSSSGRSFVDTGASFMPKMTRFL